MQGSVPDVRERQSQYSITLHPHRSLSPKAFTILMAFVGGVSFFAGMIFALQGAWPVLGFFGLDVLAIYIAFKMNFRAGRHFEVIEIQDGDLSVTAHYPNGSENQTCFQAYWSRVTIENDKLFIRCRSEMREIGHFLIEEEKAEVKEIITNALYRYRHGQIAAD